MCVETQMIHYLIGSFVIQKKKKNHSQETELFTKGKRYRVSSLCLGLQLLTQRIGLDPENGKEGSTA